MKRRETAELAEECYNLWHAEADDPKNSAQFMDLFFEMNMLLQFKTRVDTEVAGKRPKVYRKRNKRLATRGRAHA